MLSREQIQEDYRVVSGRVTRPGKFEGEMLYVPYFWEAVLDGFGSDSEDDEGVVEISVTAEDRAQFRELRGVRVVRLCEDEQGFVREV